MPSQPERRVPGRSCYWPPGRCSSGGCCPAGGCARRTSSDTKSAVACAPSGAGEAGVVNAAGGACSPPSTLPSSCERATDCGGPAAAGGRGGCPACPPACNMACRACSAADGELGGMPCMLACKMGCCSAAACAICTTGGSMPPAVGEGKVPPEALSWPPDVSRLPPPPTEPSRAMLLSQAVNWPGGGGAGRGGRPEPWAEPEKSPPGPAAAQGEAAAAVSRGLASRARSLGRGPSACGTCDNSCRAAGGPARRCRSRREPCAARGHRSLNLVAGNTATLHTLPALHAFSSSTQAPTSRQQQGHLWKAVLKLSKLSLVPLSVLQGSRIASVRKDTAAVSSSSSSSCWPKALPFLDYASQLDAAYRPSGRSLELKCG